MGYSKPRGDADGAPRETFPAGARRAQSCDPSWRGRDDAWRLTENNERTLEADRIAKFSAARNPTANHVLADAHEMESPRAEPARDDLREAPKTLASGEPRVMVATSD